MLLILSFAAMAEERPNVILIMVDDMGYSDIGCYGGEIQTPNLDALAQSGIRFRQFYNTGKCHSSRVTLLSGLHSYQAGNVGPDGTLKLHSNEVVRGVSIAEVLREAGYCTAVSGKWHIKPEPKAFGFDRFFGFLPGCIHDYFSSKKLMVDGKAYRGDEKYITDLITDHGIEFIADAQSQNKPFFLYLPYNAPHYPLQAPKEQIDKYRGMYSKGWTATRNARIAKMKTLGLVGTEWTPADPKVALLRDWDALSDADRNYQDYMMATYAGMVDSIDLNLGRIIEKLKATGEFDNTLILFFSDNGACDATMLRERELFERQTPATNGKSFITQGTDWAFVSNTPYRGFKAHMHEGGIISPLIAHWPAGIENPGGIDHKNVFHLMDIMPTLIEICGGRYPEHFEGRKIEPMNGISMAPAFAGKYAERKSGIYQMFGVNRAYRFGEWKIVSKGGCRWELYNMALDPTEQNDLAAQHPERVDTLKAMWWRVAIEDERLPPQVNQTCSDRQAKPRRFIMRQGNQRVPAFKGVDLKKLY
jgi:arylsulfatase